MTLCAALAPSQWRFQEPTAQTVLFLIKGSRVSVDRSDDVGLGRAPLPAPAHEAHRTEARGE